MTFRPRELTLAGFTGSGAVAGVLSALVFTIAHQLLISPIWFAIAAMLIAGAVSGACLAWSYAVVVQKRSTGSWVRYNLLFVAVLIALGAVSLIIFEPVTTIADLLASSEPPRALIGQALPVTLLFTLGSAGLVTLLYRPGWAGTFAIVATTLVIVLFLGLNISILGLVSVPGSSLYVIGEVLALILVLALVYVFAMAYFWQAALSGAGAGTG